MRAQFLGIRRGDQPKLQVIIDRICLLPTIDIPQPFQRFDMPVLTLKIPPRKAAVRRAPHGPDCATVSQYGIQS